MSPVSRLVARIIVTWLVLVISLAVLSIAYDLMVRGYLDLRAASLYELVALPTGLTPVVMALCWMNRRRAGNARAQ